MLVARSAVMLDAALALVVFSFAKSQQETPLSAVKMPTWWLNAK
jgi:hypothetical protein